MSQTQAPRVLKNFNAFVNGKGFAGRVEECTLPEISLKTDGIRMGGMDSEIKYDMGQEAMSAKLKFGEPDAGLLGLVGQTSANSARLVLRGSYVRDTDNARIAVVAELTGRFDKGSFDAWKSGDKSSNEYEMSVTYYRLTVGGIEVYEIDVENMIRRIYGVDQLAGVRADIGLGGAGNIVGSRAGGLLGTIDRAASRLASGLGF